MKNLSFRPNVLISIPEADVKRLIDAGHFEPGVPLSRSMLSDAVMQAVSDAEDLIEARLFDLARAAVKP